MSSSDILDSAEQLVQRELSRTSAPLPTPPGLIVTVGDSEPVQRDLAVALPLLALVRPDGVMLHTNPGTEDGPTVDALRRALPGIRSRPPTRNQLRVTLHQGVHNPQLVRPQ